MAPTLISAELCSTYTNYTYLRMITNYNHHLIYNVLKFMQLFANDYKL